jgi:hypothetical protein
MSHGDFRQDSHRHRRGLVHRLTTALAEAGVNVVMADIQKDAVEQAAHLLSGTRRAA